VSLTDIFRHKEHLETIEYLLGKRPDAKDLEKDLLQFKELNIYWHTIYSRLKFSFCVEKKKEM
jgi:hypothetical protein